MRKLWKEAFVKLENTKLKVKSMFIKNGFAVVGPVKLLAVFVFRLKIAKQQL